MEATRNRSDRPSGAKPATAAAEAPAAVEPVRQSGMVVEAIDEERSDARLIGCLQKVYIDGFSLTPEAAISMAIKTSEWMRKTTGGQTMYIPAPDLTQRNQAIRSRFTGNNHKLLATEYGLSVRRVYEILGSESREHLDRNRTAA